MFVRVVVFGPVWVRRLHCFGLTWFGRPREESAMKEGGKGIELSREERIY